MAHICTEPSNICKYKQIYANICIHKQIYANVCKYMHKTLFFSKRTQLPIFNKYNLNLCVLNNFEIGKVELVLNKLLNYLLWHFSTMLEKFSQGTREILFVHFHNLICVREIRYGGLVSSLNGTLSFLHFDFK